MVVPPSTAKEPDHLANTQGWLEDDDPFFAAIEEVVEARASHTPRVLRQEESE